jgi:hypothetical protein
MTRMAAVHQDDQGAGVDRVHQIRDLCHRYPGGDNLVGVGIRGEQVTLFIAADRLLNAVAGEVDQRDVGPARSLRQPRREVFDYGTTLGIPIGQESYVVLGKATNLRIGKEP